MITPYILPALNKLSKLISILIVLILCNTPKIISAQSCSVNAISFIDQEYDSPCEGGGLTLTPILFSGHSGTVAWFRNGAPMPAAAFVYQNQLYIVPYYNTDKGIYSAIFTESTTGCKDTSWIQTNTLTPAVVPQIEWVQDLCGEVKVKAVNANDTTASNNTYVWMDQDGYYNINGQYLITSNTTETVSITNSDGCTANTTSNIPQSQLSSPARPSAVSGANSGLCELTNKIYTVNNISGLTYNWTVPSGASIISGQGTYRIHVDFPSSSFSGYITVTASNNCGTSAARSLSVKGAPPTPGVISGPTTVCSGSAGNTYSIIDIASAISYTWTAPSGSHITANGITSSNNVLTTTANSVTVQFGTITTTSVIKVRANNDCGSSSTRSKSLTPCSPRLADNGHNQMTSLIAYPNPAREIIRIQFNTTQDQNSQCIIYDLAGKVALLENIHVVPGQNEFSFNLHSLAEGAYYLRLTLAEKSEQLQIVKF